MVFDGPTCGKKKTLVTHYSSTFLVEGVWMNHHFHGVKTMEIFTHYFYTLFNYHMSKSVQTNATMGNHYTWEWFTFVNDGKQSFIFYACNGKTISKYVTFLLLAEISAAIWTTGTETRPVCIVSWLTFETKEVGLGWMEWTGNEWF